MKFHSFLTHKYIFGGSIVPLYDVESKELNGEIDKCLEDHLIHFQKHFMQLDDYTSLHKILKYYLVSLYK